MMRGKRRQIGGRAYFVGGDDLLIDVSRLIWRVWTRRLPTGIDRVCLAYLQRYGQQARAVVQFQGRIRALSAGASRRLFALLIAGAAGERADFRAALVRMMPGLLATSRARVVRPGTLYLNIGHTGLDAEALPAWIARNRLKAVHLVHDLIPVTHPEFCRAGEDERHARRMVHALQSAAGVIGNSQATLDELAAFAATRGLALPPSIDAWISGNPISAVSTPSRMDRPYFVTVGTIEGRKNHILLLNLWQQMAERMGPRTPVLVIIGQRGWEADLAIAMLDRATALKGHVRELGRCDDTELARLIAGARALLMPSFVEGFGLPVVESLVLGTPVIASDLPVFREIAAGIPLLLDPADGAGWEQAILAFVGDCPERQRQIAAMRGYRAPDWDSHFARVDPWLDTL